MGRALLLLIFVSGVTRAASVPGEWIVSGPWRVADSGFVARLDAAGRFALFRGARPAHRALRVQRNFLYRASGATADWGLEKIEAPAAWQHSQGEGVTIAILDTGISGATVGWNFVADDGNVADDNGHGTRVAAIAARVAPRARLLAVKALDANGIVTTARAIAAVDYAVRQGAAVLNASWSGPEHDDALRATLADAGQRGALFVTAAGNDGEDNDSALEPAFPASYAVPSLIAVAAYDATDRRAFFSNYGKSSVDIGAPGVGIDGADGTSFAAPFVSGVAALLVAREPALRPEAVKERLLATSVLASRYEMNHTRSGGRVCAKNALLDERPARPVTPSEWEVSEAMAATAHPYEPKTFTRWRFDRPGATHVRVHFARMETEACCDRIVLKDGNGRVVISYGGTREPFWSAEAVGETVIVEFSSDYVKDGWGFAIDAIGAARAPVLLETPATEWSVNGATNVRREIAWPPAAPRSALVSPSAH